MIFSKIIKKLYNMEKDQYIKTIKEEFDSH